MIINLLIAHNPVFLVILQNILRSYQGLHIIGKATKDDALITEDHKLHLSVSVDVLTLLARSAKDSKLILNKQMAGMFRNISKFCRTKNAENPSASSMLNKSYVAERNNKKAAIDILHEMIKNINRYCFVPLLISYNFLDGVMDMVFGG